MRRFAGLDGVECDETVCLGEALPYEQQRRTALGLEPLRPGNHHHDSDLDDHDELEGDCPWRDEVIQMAPDLAAAISINPLDLNPDTPTTGTGLLALTPYGRRHGIPPGALPI